MRSGLIQRVVERPPQQELAAPDNVFACRPGRTIADVRRMKARARPRRRWSAMIFARFRIALSATKHRPACG